MNKVACFTVITWLAFYGVNAKAEAYVPTSDAEVLERLPVSLKERKNFKQAQIVLNKAPGDFQAALNLAKDYIRVGRAQSDPRYYSYAEAVLKPWLKRPNARAEALVLKATILQNRHDFPAALTHLQNALKQNSKLPQAWLTQAAIYEVQGEYMSALSSCLMLARLSTSVTSDICANSALSLSGQAELSYQKMLATLDGHNQSTSEELTWAYTLLAELAERIGLHQDAEKWYKKALKQNFRSVYLLTGYADFLLAQNRPAEVITLLNNEMQADALLLRLTLAEQKIHAKSFDNNVKKIQDRIAAAQARGDTVHQGDEARFNLHVLKDAQSALALALSNWAVQKEPRDARILLEAAIAAKQPDAALPVLEFIKSTRLEDKRLMAYVAELEG